MMTAGIASALLIGCKGGGVRPIPSVLESGEAAYRGHDYPRAEADFAEVMERDPGSSRARYWLGRSLLAQGKSAAAREQFEVALAADVENDKIYAGLCEALYQDGKLDDLFRLLRQRASEHGSVEDYLQLAAYSRKAGDVDEAHTALLTAARLDAGRRIEPQLALADFYESVNNEVEASRRLRMAYYITAENPDLNERLKALGHRLGPGLGLKPLERP